MCARLHHSARYQPVGPPLIPFRGSRHWAAPAGRHDCAIVTTALQRLLTGLMQLWDQQEEDIRRLGSLLPALYGHTAAIVRYGCGWEW